MASSNTMSGTDVQYVVTKLMGMQKENGCVYLQGEALPAQIKEAHLSAPGDHFCVAGTIKEVTKTMADGPSLVLQFHVPAERCGAKVLSPFQLELQPHDADKYIMTGPSAGREAVN